MTTPTTTPAATAAATVTPADAASLVGIQPSVKRDAARFAKLAPEVQERALLLCAAAMPAPLNPAWRDAMAAAEAEAAGTAADMADAAAAAAGMAGEAATAAHEADTAAKGAAAAAKGAARAAKGAAAAAKGAAAAKPAAEKAPATPKGPAASSAEAAALRPAIAGYVVRWPHAGFDLLVREGEGAAADAPAWLARCNAHNTTVGSDSLKGAGLLARKQRPTWCTGCAAAAK